MKHFCGPEICSLSGEQTPIIEAEVSSPAGDLPLPSVYVSLITPMNFRCKIDKSNLRSLGVPSGRQLRSRNDPRVPQSLTQ